MTVNAFRLRETRELVAGTALMLNDTVAIVISKRGACEQRVDMTLVTVFGIERRAHDGLMWRTLA